MNYRPIGIALLTLLLGLSTAYLVLALPNWLPALPTIAFAVALALVGSGRAIGYSFGLAGLFAMFVFGVAYVIGDAEEPTLSYVSMPRYIWLAIACAIFMALAWVLKRAQSQQGPHGEF